MTTFGEELRRERKLRGIRLREVADATKINLRYLEALEANDFEHLPGGVFNRGFVRAYSQYIGVDPDAMVNAYLLEEQAQQAPGKPWDKQLFRPSRDAREESEPKERGEPTTRGRMLVRSAWITIVLLLAVILCWVVIRYFDGRGQATERPVEASVPQGDGVPTGDESE